jgi:hypothetical protein
VTAWKLPRLSTEWVGPITVTRDGNPVTGWKIAIFPHAYQPAAVTEIAETPSTLSGGLGILVGPGTSHALAPGLYRLWIRYVSAPEAPVLNTVGTVQIM